MASSRVILLALLTVSLWAADPVLPGGTCEVHGTWRTGERLEPFWARLLPPAPAYGGHRMLQIVYTPPPPASLGGTHLADCPFVLVDGAGRIIAWNERLGQSEAQRQNGGYRILLDRTPADHLAIETVTVEVTGPPAWDLGLAPLLLALGWKAGGSASVPVRDLYGDRGTGTVSWEDATVTLAGRACRIEPSAAGRLARLTALPGDLLLTIDGYRETSP